MKKKKKKTLGGKQWTEERDKQVESKMPKKDTDLQDLFINQQKDAVSQIDREALKLLFSELID